MVVYVDLVFALNLLFDATTLHLTAWSRKLKARRWRIWAAACMGAAYALLMFVPGLSVLFTLTSKLVVSAAMVAAAFGCRSLQEVIRNLTAFYFVNFAAAGCIFGLHFLLQSHGELLNGMLFARSGGLTLEFKAGLVFLLTAFFLSAAVYKTVLRGVRRKDRLSRYLADVTVRIGGREIRCQGLVDTGNNLSDPLTGTPVMIMEAELWSGAIDPGWLKRAGGGTDAELLEAVESAGEGRIPWPERLRLVPYRGIRRGTAFLLAFRPDEVIIRLDGREFATKKVLVGLRGEALAADGAYRAVIHPALLEDGLPEEEDTRSVSGGTEHKWTREA